MPSADGVTAIASWMLSCVFFVFCALMSYAYLLWRLKPSLLKRHWRREGKNETIGKNKEAAEEGEEADPNRVSVRSPSRSASKREPKEVHMVRVDDICMVVFPVVFGLFHLMYWTICLTRQPEVDFNTFYMVKDPEVVKETFF